ncbi:MAG: transcriptional regulator [Micavibrio sp.]|nr:transcriptional regulator [Micavibrio sp.]
MENVGKELIKLFKTHRSFLNEKLASIGLYAGQEGLLFHLSQNDGLTMSQLTEKMSIQHATLFTMVERMAKNDLIVKRKDEEDKRTSRILLTSNGRKKLERLSTIWLETEKQIIKGLTQSEIKTFIELTIKINNNLNK